MKKYFSKLRINTGFTLIELLVVIGILGVLAAMLVATIDPFEQIKKANDSKVQNTAVEFEDSLIRYYTAQSGFPWDATDTDGTACAAAFTPAYTSGATTLAALDLQSGVSCLNELIDTGELKAGFTSIVGVLNTIYVTSQNLTNKTVQVCYYPLSKSGQKDIGANWKATTGTVADHTTVWSEDTQTTHYCTSMGGTHGCWWCTQ